MRFENFAVGDKVRASPELKRAAHTYHMGYANNLASVANPAFLFLVKNKIVPVILDDGTLLLRAL